ncbi:F-box/kelch-repeat protein-like protein [Tanacetum coccineum]
MTLKDKNQEQEQQPSKRIKTSSYTSQTTTLLQEIIVEILSRLPVESLLRCKSVCKEWYSLISDNHFIKSHLALSINNLKYKHHKLVISTVPRINIKSCNLNNVLFHDDSGANLSELDYPLKHPRKSVWIVGSCNGLLCIAIEEDSLFIWNPSTRRSNTLPYCGFKAKAGSYVLYGFGYDEGSEDYKVVGISCVFKSGGKYDVKVKVFSLKGGNWKKVGGFPHGIPLDDSGKFCGGAVHWAASESFGSSYSWRIVSFDLGKESYGEVLQPVFDEGDKDLSLGVLGEKLCVLCNYRGNRADVWVMMDYGVKESWTKLVSVPYLTDPGRDQFSVPLVISNDGKVLLQFGSKLVVYDSEKGSSLEIQDMDECLESCLVVESLVSPDTPIRRWR